MPREFTAATHINGLEAFGGPAKPRGYIGTLCTPRATSLLSTIQVTFLPNPADSLRFAG